MEIQKKCDGMFDSTMVPDIFITESMIHLSDKAIKIYLYMIYHLKKNDKIDLIELGNVFNLNKEAMSNVLTEIETEGLVVATEKGYEFVDIKEKELNRIYSPKIVEKKARTKSESVRGQAILAINNTFFHGVMNLSWYTDIEVWFKRYSFDDDVMLALFNYCAEKKKLNRRYVEVVAEAWGAREIKTFNDLESYFNEMDKLQKMEKLIIKSLRLNRNLTQYEFEMVDKWVNEYNYTFEIVEHAIKKTAAKTNPSISYINGIISKWHEAGLTKLEEIKTENQKYVDKNKAKITKDSGNKKFENREYDDFSQFYDNLKQ